MLRWFFWKFGVKIVTKNHPLGFYGIENADPKLEEIEHEAAVKLIRAAGLTLTWSLKTIDKAVAKNNISDLKRFYMDYRKLLDVELFNKYKNAIVRQPKELISWALQFVER